MIIYVDADSCPVRIREIISKAAGNRRVKARFVAARSIPIKSSPWIELIVVEPGQDAADIEIQNMAEPGDMVITRDIPLAAELVEQGLTVLNDRGTQFTPENIRTRLSERNFMAELRAMGLESMKDRSFSAREIQAFASAFDRELTRLLKS